MIKTHEIIDVYFHLPHVWFAIKPGDPEGTILENTGVLPGEDQRRVNVDISLLSKLETKQPQRISNDCQCASLVNNNGDSYAGDAEQSRYDQDAHDCQG